MTLFLNWFKLQSGTVRPVRPSTQEYHALRCAQELAMARKARSPAAANAHATLAAAHQRASDGALPETLRSSAARHSS
ncbi:MAG: hypothetical protein PGN21_03440 [Sphingomonas paucimobilis]